MIKDEGDRERVSGEGRGSLLPLTEVEGDAQRQKVSVHSAVYVT